MTIYVCDRCGARLTGTESGKLFNLRHEGNVNGMNRTFLNVYCDKIGLRQSDLQTYKQLDLCENCMASFVQWFGEDTKVEMELRTWRHD